MSTNTLPARPDIGALRVATLDTILALHREHGLALPADIHTGVCHQADLTFSQHVALTFDKDRHADVDAWAAMLGLPPAQPYSSGSCRWYKTQHSSYFNGPVWLGWNSVELTTFTGGG